MDTNQKGFIVYGDTKSLADELTDEQLGKLFRGMLAYFADGTTPKFSGILKFAFIPIKQQMDRDAEKYRTKCEKNRENIQAYWDRTKANDRIRTNTTATNTKTKTDTDTNTKTDTDTDTTTKTNTDTDAALKQQDSGGGSTGDGLFNIWKRMTPEDVDRVYDAFPNTGGILIDEVYAEVKRGRREVKDPVAYILGYAKRVGWDDAAEHEEVS